MPDLFFYNNILVDNFDNIELKKQELLKLYGLPPKKPGVYKFSNEKNQVLYVGKSKNLFNRISNYLTPSGTLHGRMPDVILKATKLEWFLTTNEVEAYVLESIWIRTLKPKYNIKLIDTDSLGGVYLSKSNIPKLGTWRGKRFDETYSFGPFPNLRSKDLINTLSEIFKVRTCKDSFLKKHESLGKPCILGEIGKCAMPCLGGEYAAVHKNKSESLLKYLSNKNDTIISTLNCEMEKFSSLNEFEKAKIRRDQIKVLKKIEENQIIDSSLKSVINVFTYSVFKDIAVITLLEVSYGKITSIRTFSSEIDSNLSENKQFFQILSLSLSDEKSSSLKPNEVVLNIELSSRDREIFRDLLDLEENVKVYKPKTGKKLELINFALNNSNELLGTIELKASFRIKSKEKALDELSKYLGSKKSIIRIECIDISHTQGKLPVASIVVSENGDTVKNQYRKIFIPTEFGGDDISSIKHAVERRFTGSKCGLKTFPDLLLIDGGINQVNIAKKVIDELFQGSEENILVAGIAKKLEEIYLPNISDPIIISRNSDALKLCIKIRDEAHRYAIISHRDKREKEFIKNLFDKIPNIGDSKRRILKEHYKTDLSLYETNFTELSSIRGISSKLAKEILEFIHDVKN